MDSRGELLRHAQEYAVQRGLLIREQLGFGVHGIVFTPKVLNSSAQGSVAETRCFRS
jgi:hypothetical protein